MRVAILVVSDRVSQGEMIDKNAQIVKKAHGADRWNDRG